MLTVSDYETQRNKLEESAPFQYDEEEGLPQCKYCRQTFDEDSQGMVDCLEHIRLKHEAPNGR